MIFQNALMSVRTCCLETTNTAQKYVKKLKIDYLKFSQKQP